MPEIDGLAFSAKLLPVDEKVFGFLYFNSAVRPGAFLYVNGLPTRPPGKITSISKSPSRIRSRRSAVEPGC